MSDVATSDSPVARAISSADVALFVDASRDRSPLHVSEEYARATAFGRPVAHGVLGALTCLAELPETAGLTIVGADFSFLAPTYPDVSYRVRVAAREGRADACRVQLTDGRRVLLRGDVDYGVLADTATLDDRAPDQWRRTARDPREAGLQPGDFLTGTYSPDWKAVEALDDRYELSHRGVCRSLIAALMCGSYSAGMEYPGSASLLCRLQVSLSRRLERSAGQFGFSLCLNALDDRIAMAKLAGTLTDATGRPWAHLNVGAIVRSEVEEPRAADVEEVSQCRPSLEGKRALVVGGSRGLGAAISLALAAAGCRVHVMFAGVPSYASRLEAAARERGWKLFPVHGDAADLAACDAVRSEMAGQGPIDILVCNACPAPQPLWVEPSAVPRLSAYLASAFALVAAPLSTFAPDLVRAQGWHVLISSAYAASAPADLPHYAAAKAAVEGLARAAAAGNPTLRTLIVRPGKLLTEMNNTPLGRHGAVSPATVARHIVYTLAEGAAPGTVRTI